ncbi:phage minor head protein [Hominenteromicrobium sp.]|jgi:SPP1 gp7 family putative phage head morphogenesis protein|uniref:phage head morphogenesis protein n=1 Tax=Hominenteromicrobium sp. TaxID=3073581 RepID=UPI003AB8FDDD
MPNSDLGHKLTDKELAKLERRIATLYREAGEELQATIDAYFEQFKKRDEEMKALIGTVQNGKEWTEQDYKQWRLNQIGRGERYQAMRDKVAHRVTDANAVAVSYTNDATPGIYSLNRNYAAYTIESVAGNVGFDLWDEQTVKRLMVEQPDLMPYYPPKRALKRGIDLAYGKKQITASVTSSILQGKSIKHMADDLQKRISTMSRDSAIRTARTAVTGAQNAGRMDSYAAAEKMGIKLKKCWLATLDARTRHSHAMLDGEQVAQDKKFSNGCRFPGDPQGPPWEIYNCRCTLIAAVEGVDTSSAQRRAKNADTGQTEVVSNMSYAEWAGWKKDTKQVASAAKSAIIEESKPLPITISDCTTETRKYDFSDGTENGTRKSANATVYKTPDGTEFVFPVSYNKAHQTMTPEKAVELWGKVPEKLRDMGQKQIIFQDVHNPQDKYWRKRYKKFRGSYATGGDDINFWRYDHPHNDDYVVRTYCHEIGHKVDTDNSVNGTRFSEYTWWTDAMAEDKKVSGQKSVTVYGENANSEDFAESVAEFVKNPDVFRKMFPNRAKIIDIFLR